MRKRAQEAFLPTKSSTCACKHKRVTACKLHATIYLKASLGCGHIVAIKSVFFEYYFTWSRPNNTFMVLYTLVVKNTLKILSSRHVPPQLATNDTAQAEQHLPEKDNSLHTTSLRVLMPHFWVQPNCISSERGHPNLISAAASPLTRLWWLYLTQSGPPISACHANNSDRSGFKCIWFDYQMTRSAVADRTIRVALQSALEEKEAWQSTG